MTIQEFIPGTGQSRCLGASGKPALSAWWDSNGIAYNPWGNKRVSGGQAVALVETTINPPPATSLEAPRSGALNTLSELGGGTAWNRISAQVGATYDQIKKGSTLYQQLITQCTQSKTLATNQGKTLVARAHMLWWGESAVTDGTENLVSSRIQQLQIDYQNDFSGITGQTDPVPMFFDQISSWTAYQRATSRVPIQQLAAAKENPACIMIGACYPYVFKDSAHMTNVSYRANGAQFGKVMHRVLRLGETWLPLHCTSAVALGNEILASFHVPVEPLVIDTSLVVSKLNNGFEVVDSGGGSLMISSVILMEDGHSVLITMSSPVPTGSLLRYAYTGTPGSWAGSGTGSSLGSARGNLRDSDSYVSLWNDPCYNWCVTFEEPIFGGV